MQLNTLKKFVYLISPNKINKDFFFNLEKVLSFKNVKFFQLRLKRISQNSLINIVLKANSFERLSLDEALLLANNSTIPQLGSIANRINTHKSKNKVYFNRNIHIEPTNVCINHCLFCSYRRRKGQNGSWEYSIDEMIDIAQKAVDKDPQLTEFHIVGLECKNCGSFNTKKM